MSTDRSGGRAGGLLAWVEADGHRLAALVSLLESWSRRPGAFPAFQQALRRWRRSAGGWPPDQVLPPALDGLPPDAGTPADARTFCFQTALALLARWPFLLHGQTLETNGKTLETHGQTLETHGKTLPLHRPAPGMRESHLLKPWSRAHREWPLAFSPSPFDWWLDPSLGPVHRELEPLLPGPGEVFLPLPGQGTTPGLESVDSLDAVDVLGSLYQWAYPPFLRQRRGEFYTPAPVAAALMDELAPEQHLEGLLLQGQADKPAPGRDEPGRGDPSPPGLILDPACGTGVFLAAACRRLALQRGTAAAARALRMGLIAGIEIQPLAALACRIRLNLLLPELREAGSLHGWSRVVKTRDALGVRPGPQARRFHCVVGNPPYVRASRIPAPYRAWLRRRFEAYQGAADLSVAFIQHAVEWTLPGGRLRLVISDKPLVNRYGGNLRRFLDAHCSRWEATEYREAATAFEGALVDTLILKATRRTGESHGGGSDDERRGEASSGNDGRGAGEGGAGRRHAGASGGWSLAGTVVRGEHGPLLEAMEAGSLPLEAFGALRGGVMGFHYQKALSLLHQHPDGTGLPPGLPVIAAGQIRPFHADWNHPVKLLGEERRRMYLPLEALDGGGSWPGAHQVFTPALQSFSRAPKILIKGVAPRLTAAWDPRGLGFLVAVWGFRPEGIDPWLALALLNSPLLDFYARARLYRQRIPRGSWRFPKTLLAHFPLPAALKGWSPSQGEAQDQPPGEAAARRGEPDLQQAAARLRRWAQSAHRDPLPGAHLPHDPGHHGASTGGRSPSAHQLLHWAGLLYGLDPGTIRAIARARLRLGWA